VLPRAVQGDIDAFVVSGNDDPDTFAPRSAGKRLAGVTGRRGQSRSSRWPVDCATPGGLESADLKAVERKGLKVLLGDLAARLPTSAVLSQSQKKVI
jgi:hypothetical protein